MNRKYTIRGKFNEIMTRNIGKGTVISGWTFIGKKVKIGKNCRLGNYINIDSFSVIGDNVNIQPYTAITVNSIIEDDVFVGADVSFIDEKYPTPFVDVKTRNPIVVRKGALIGTGVKIVCSTIGRGSVIGAHSLVLQDIPDNEVWAGIPARYIMERKAFDKKRELWYKMLLTKK